MPEATKGSQPGLACVHLLVGVLGRAELESRMEAARAIVEKDGGPLEAENGLRVAWSVF